MSQSLSSVFVHVIFGTKARARCLAPEIRERLYAEMAVILKDLRCPAQIFGGMEDHIHILCRLHKTVAIADLVEKVKAPTSKWLKTQAPDLRNFQWQGGYGAFSVSKSLLEKVTSYIRNQADHHQGRTFQQEYLGFLHKYEVEYDERYLWD